MCYDVERKLILVFAMQAVLVKHYAVQRADGSFYRAPRGTCPWVVCDLAVAKLMAATVRGKVIEVSPGGK
jgi:hypothetical protein